MKTKVSRTELGPPIHESCSSEFATVSHNDVQKTGLASITDRFLGDIAADKLAVSEGNPSIIGAEVFLLLIGLVVLFLHFKAHECLGVLPRTDHCRKNLFACPQRHRCHYSRCGNINLFVGVAKVRHKPTKLLVCKELIALCQQVRRRQKVLTGSD